MDRYDRRADGVREPDPTLGTGFFRPTEELPRIRLLPHGGVEPEPAARPRRQRIVLAEPRREPIALRAKVELEQQTSWGERLIQELIEKQRRVAALLAALVLSLLGALPLAFYFSPGFASLRLLGIPVPWVLLGVAPFPLLFAVGLWYNRLAERHERAFVEMVENEY
jgi:uncharacterized membrane protein (DUF485 family)